MERVKSLESVLGMKGGDEDTSYARVSLLGQLKMIQVIKPILEHEIPQYLNLHKLMKGGDGVFRIADFGCATGINTLLVADTIVRAVQTACISQSIELPEFQVYFADLPSNDFNSLLRSLPPHEQLRDHAHKLDEDERAFAEPPATRSYFAAMVCGSFYKRLFPPKSLHFCHSSNSLHWLSQVNALLLSCLAPQFLFLAPSAGVIEGRIMGESICLEVEAFEGSGNVKSSNNA